MFDLPKPVDSEENLHKSAFDKLKPNFRNEFLKLNK